MNELGKLVGELFLSGVDGAALELFIFCDLIERHKCQHLHALDNVTVTDISPILEELVGRSLFGVEPNSAALGLAHLLALAVGEQVKGHTVDLGLFLTANKLYAADDVRPLVVAAEFETAAVVLVQTVEIVALHEHVVEFKKC